jgi:hypothetical protein
MERDVFGLDPKTTPTSARPTYGYARTPILSSFINKLFGIKGKNFNAVTRNVGEDSLAKYGNIDLVTKGSVAKRSSAFAGDALVRYHWAAEAQSFKRRAADLKVRLTRTGVQPAPMKGASPEQLGSFDGFGSPFKRYKNEAPAYVETYTPGGFKFSEIDKIIARDPAIAKRLKDELRAAGLGGVRVTGSNFAARLFKKLGVPGYESGIESVPDAASKEFEAFKRTQISELRENTRGAPNAFRAAHADLSYPGAEKVAIEAARKYEERARKDGVPEKDIQSTVKKYLGTEVSHLRKDTRLINLDGTELDIKNWRAQNVIKESAIVNQLLQNMDQLGARDSKGKKISGLSFLQSLDPKEIAKMSGLSEKAAQRELKKLINGDHPVTKNATKAFLAISDKYLQQSPSKSRFARVDALQHVLRSRLKDRTFFDAVRNGTLSLPKSFRSKVDAAGLKAQNSSISLRAGKVAEARTRLLGSSSGVPVPSSVQVQGGNPRDKRMIGVASGETVLTNDTTDTLRKGGSAQIPGVGKIIGYGRNGRPIRMPGAYDGIPEGQTQEDAPRRQQQRDPVTGRFVSSKTSAAPAPASRFAGMGGKVAAGASFAGMGAMMYGMSGGPGADMAMMASMPLMMAPMLAPLMSLFKSPWAAAAVAIAAVVTSVVLLRNTFNDAQKEALKTAETLGSSTEAMKKLADFAGTVSSGEIMDRVRKDRLQLVTRGTGKTTFGEAFVQTEDGKAAVDAAKKQLATGGSDSVINSLTSQLSTAIVSGVLTPEQAKSMAANLAYELGDMKIGIQVSANIVDLVGPDGQDLTGSGMVEIAAKMNERSMESINGQMDMLNKNVSQNPLGSELGRNLGMGGAVAAGAALGAAVGSVIPIVGTMGGAILGAVAGGVIGFQAMQEETKKLGAMSGAVVGEMINGLEAQREIASALDVYYMKKIEEAKVQGDITEQLRLQAEYEGKKREMSEIETQMRSQTRQALEAGGPGLEATRLGIQTAIETRFKDDSAAQISLAPAKATLDRLQGSNQISQADRDVINLELATTMDPTALNSLLMFVGEDEKQVDALVNIIGNYGGDFATEAQNVLNLIEDK